MADINLGNVVGLIKQELAPAKTYVIWAKILNPAFPDVVELYIFDAAVGLWVLLKSVGGFIKIVLDYTDFATAAAANDITLVSLPAGYKFEELVVKHSIAFVGGGTASANVTVGIAGELDKYVFTGLNVFAAPTDTGFIDDNVNQIENWGAATDVRAELTITGDTLDNVTAGEIEFYIYVKRVKI